MTKFYIHSQTPKTPTPKSLKVLLACAGVLLYGNILFGAVACSIMAKSPLPALLILLPVSAATAALLLLTWDMERSYIEIKEERILVVRYRFGRKKEEHFLLSDLSSATIRHGHSLLMPGLRYTNQAWYIVFKDQEGRYLFKVLATPEARVFFGAYVSIDEP